LLQTQGEPFPDVCSPWFVIVWTADDHIHSNVHLACHHPIWQHHPVYLLAFQSLIFTFSAIFEVGLFLIVVPLLWN